MIPFRHPCVRLLLALMFCVASASADEVRVAAASNFAGAMDALVPAFEAETGHRVRVSHASTGKLYAQIRQGAPFDVLLAADEAHPRRLEEAGVGLSGSRFTYALGVLVLWPAEGESEDRAMALLRESRRVALANPRLAPYGRAARQALVGLGVADALSGRLVRGENIGQTYQFVATGNAEVGFIALSQWRDRPRGDYWPVPSSLYDPIIQQAMVLRDTAAARAFADYLRSKPARRLIRRAGYELPGLN